MKIHNNIPMPKNTKAGRPTEYPFASMNKGDSIFFEGAATGHRAYVAAMNYGRNHDMKFSGRKYELDGVEGLMIWRIA